MKYPYETPKLTNLGSIRELTMAGGGARYSDGFSIYCPEDPPIARS